MTSGLQKKDSEDGKEVDGKTPQLFVKVFFRE